eukprot:scaffold6925_cov116-Cylindrotheca_fusiformis.AAC.5
MQIPSDSAIGLVLEKNKREGFDTTPILNIHSPERFAMSNMNTITLLLLLLASSAHAFVAPLGSGPTTTTTTTGNSIHFFTVPKLNDIDLMSIENVAELCLQAEEDAALADECDLDEHEALVNQLQAQKSLLLDQVAYMDDLLSRLSKGSLAP